MSIITVDGCAFNVEIAGVPDKPALMLSNSLGADLHMWDAQAEALARDYRLIRYDRRGHGASAVTPGPYTMEQLGHDALGILDALGIAQVNWCGLSMGGMVGMWLGAKAPERIARLILSNTSSYYADKAVWNTRMQAVREKGLELIADGLMALWFSQNFRAREPDAVARMRAALVATPLEGYLGCCAAVRDMDHRALLKDIAAPTLVIAGRHDMATTVVNAEFIRGEIPGATLTVLDAAHIANVEQPDAYLQAVRRFMA